MHKMPVIFVGHGSPMNAIETNAYTESWSAFREHIPERPRAILMFSAHWIATWETRISTASHPEMIYDMYGFPEELYRVRYDAPGAPGIATEIRDILAWQGIEVIRDAERGYDHGIWSVLMHIFPDADIPVVQISLDYSASPQYLYDVGKQLSMLREQGILILWSGNIVHNLGAIDWSWDRVYPWAVEFDRRIEQGIISREYEDIMEFEQWGDMTRLAHPMHDHLLPLFPLLGAVSDADNVNFFTPEISMGSLSMRSIVWKN